MGYFVGLVRKRTVLGDSGRAIRHPVFSDLVTRLRTPLPSLAPFAAHVTHPAQVFGVGLVARICDALLDVDETVEIDPIGLHRTDRENVMCVFGLRLRARITACLPRCAAGRWTMGRAFHLHAYTYTPALSVD